jgi:hypothetical protein
MQRNPLPHKRKTQKSSWSITLNTLTKLASFAFLLVSGELFKLAAANETGMRTTEIMHFRPGTRTITVSPLATVAAYPGNTLFVTADAINKRTKDQIEISQRPPAPYITPTEEEYLGQIMQGGTLRETYYGTDNRETGSRKFDFNVNPNVVVETISTSAPLPVEQKPYKTDTIVQFRPGNNRKHMAKPHENLQAKYTCSLAVSGSALDSKTADGAILVTQKNCGNPQIEEVYSGTLFHNNKIKDREEFKRNGFATTTEHNVLQTGSDVTEYTRSYYKL